MPGRFLSCESDRVLQPAVSRQRQDRRLCPPLGFWIGCIARVFDQFSFAIGARLNAVLAYLIGCPGVAQQILDLFRHPGPLPTNSHLGEHEELFAVRLRSDRRRVPHWLLDLRFFFTAKDFLFTLFWFLTRVFLAPFLLGLFQPFLQIVSRHRSALEGLCFHSVGKG